MGRIIMLNDKDVLTGIDKESKEWNEFLDNIRKQDKENENKLEG